MNSQQSGVSCFTSTLTTTDPDSVNLIPLFTKLTKICFSRRGSPITLLGQSKDTNDATSISIVSERISITLIDVVWRKFTAPHSNMLILVNSRQTSQIEET